MTNAQMATVDAMRVANKEMKKQYKGIDIDKIEVGGMNWNPWKVKSWANEQSIHYDMEDLIEQANEIQESLGRSYGVPDEVDEMDLQAGEWSGLVVFKERLGDTCCSFWRPHRGSGPELPLTSCPSSLSCHFQKFGS